MLRSEQDPEALTSLARKIYLTVDDDFSDEVRDAFLLVACSPVLSERAGDFFAAVHLALAGVIAEERADVWK